MKSKHQPHLVETIGKHGLESTVMQCKGCDYTLNGADVRATSPNPPTINQILIHEHARHHKHKTDFFGNEVSYG